MLKSCVLIVHNMWLVLGKLSWVLCITRFISGEVDKPMICARFVQNLYPVFYHNFLHNFYLLCGQLYTSSTGLTKTTTIYIKE